MVFCPKCGSDNKEDAKFCVKCGTQLSTPSDISSKPAIHKGKSPIVAAALNLFIFWGLGYWYLGIKKIYGLPWYALFGAQVLLGFIWGVTDFGILALIILIINIALAYDVYQKGIGKEGFVPIG